MTTYLWCTSVYMQMAHPVFPPEIECLIFTAALEMKLEDKERVDLLLVAKRVYKWLLPRIFRTVAIRAMPPSRRYPRLLSVNALEKNGHHTRNLLLSISYDFTEWIPQDRLLSFCPNVTNLVLHSRNHPERIHLEHMACLPLTHLSTDMEGLPNSAPELLPLFSRITHLSTIHLLSNDNPTRFSSLTHLAIVKADNEMDYTLILKDYPELEVLVLLESGLAVEVVGVFDAKVDEPRMVRITFRDDDLMEDWFLDVKEGRGMWWLAHDEVRRRRKLIEGLREVPK
ncbi:hypothetical protein BDN72DRAFT_179872 [Pluteus cervinus]|uniref:Uncharacterized protein n=1 Tax=Pluteus cervinus TaxID=181527 RepID=A0ACD3AJD1_9AGAR|nr:hypothetical protein BDN72DRAFT_179872 [Pluteus cervinus]